MRHVFAIVMIALFTAGIFVMSIAENVDGYEGFVFTGGLLMSTLAFLIPIERAAD